MEQKEGSVIGGMLLIAGSCIGAGMLGLPVLTAFAGFFPSLIMFFCAWAFMTLTGLLLVEVNGWFEKPVHFTTMVGHTLGVVGRVLTLMLFLFLFYALLIAYVAGSGHHISDILAGGIPPWLGSIFFVIFFGSMVYLGTRAVDITNRWLMVGKIIFYLALIIFGMKFVKAERLFYSDFEYALFPLPILIISFGFHNMIPSLTNYLGGDIKRVKQSIIGGSIFTLLIYLFWQIVALGIVPVDGKHSFFEGFKKGIDGAQILGDYLSNGWIETFAFGLAFFAILTSFLAQSLSLVHFLADGFKAKKGKRENIGLCLLAFVPALVFAIIYPDILYAAFNFAGGICAVILFGLFPAMMVFIGRYIKKIEAPYRVFGGKALLACIFLFALFVFFYQLTFSFGFSLFPHP